MRRDCSSAAVHCGPVSDLKVQGAWRSRLTYSRQFCGVHRCKADHYRYPIYQYEDNNCILQSGILRCVKSSGYEARMGYPRDYTRLAWNRVLWRAGRFWEAFVARCWGMRFTFLSLASYWGSYWFSIGTLHAIWRLLGYGEVMQTQSSMKVYCSLLTVTRWRAMSSSCFIMGQLIVAVMNDSRLVLWRGRMLDHAIHFQWATDNEKWPWVFLIFLNINIYKIIMIFIIFK